MINNIQLSKNRKAPWNKGKLIGQKPPLKPQEIWAIRVRLQIFNNFRDLALFNIAIDSKLRSCDLVKLKVRDISHGTCILKRAIVMQQKTSQPVQFEITQQTRDSLQIWIQTKALSSDDYLFPSRNGVDKHITTRQYSRIVKSWVQLIGLSPNDYGTHSLRRTKVTLIYKRTKNLRAIQLLLGHTKLESTVRYLGVRLSLKLSKYASQFSQQQRKSKGKYALTHFAESVLCNLGRSNYTERTWQYGSACN